MKTRKPSTEEIENVIIKTGGNISAIANTFKYERGAVYKWIRGNKRLEAAVEQARESMIDFAEGKLAKAMQQDDLTAVIFFLKTQGRKRGYVEKQEVELSNIDKITINYINDTDGD